YTSNPQTPFLTFRFPLPTHQLTPKIQQPILHTPIKPLPKHTLTPIFPKLLFSIKNPLNFTPQHPNYHIKQLPFQSSTKRIYPHILNYHKLLELLGHFKPPIPCPSFLPTSNNHE
uniref:anaerobic ribonucleoside-triphosphate reductase n=1 Tax=Staphylococcus epidermidis TaxID=1282 RepID=UPI0028CB97CB